MSERLIPPGGEGKIEVKLTTRGKRGRVTKSVRVSSNDPDTPVVNLQISADIEILLGLQPAVVMLGNLTPGQTVTRSVELVGKLAKEARIVEVQPPEHLTISTKRLDEDGKRKVELSIQVAKDAPGDRRLNGMARFAMDQPEAAQLTLHLRGNVRGRISIKPARVVIRRQNATDSKILRFEVAARNGVEFNVLSATDEGKMLHPEVEPIEAGHRYSVRADVPGGATLARTSGTITVRTNDAETPLLKVPYSIVTTRAGKSPVHSSEQKSPPPAKKPGVRE